MRRLERNRPRAEEEESVFVTMTDMTISFLLIIMILLAFFATQLNSDDTVPLSAYEQVRSERDRLVDENRQMQSTLEVLQAEIEQLVSDLEIVTVERDRFQDENLQMQSTLEALEAEMAQLQADLERVTVERDQLIEEKENLTARVAELEAEIVRLLSEIDRLNAEIEQLQVVNPLEAYLSQSINQRREILVELRDRLLIEFPELQVVISPEQDALRFQGEGLFRSGSSRLELRQRQIVETMGGLLDQILICFTLGERAQRGAGCKSGNALIEAVQIEGHTDSDGSDLNNLRLSTDRANATLLVMLDDDRTILAHQNLRGQPVMSVSGYGEMRPIETNDTEDGKAANRRIDLRIIMYAPSTVEEVEEVGRRLDRLRDAGRVE